MNLDSKELSVKYAREPRVWLERLEKYSDGKLYWNGVSQGTPMWVHMETVRLKLVQTGWCRYLDMFFENEVEEMGTHHCRLYRVVTPEKRAEPMPMALAFEKKSGIFDSAIVRPNNLLSRDWLIQFLVRHEIERKSLYLDGSLTLNKVDFNKMMKECDPISVVSLV